MGSPRVNSSFVTSKSALFGVEVDYNAFVQSNKVVSDEEFQRRKEQLDHEGLMGIILDFNVNDYVNYKRDSVISRDMAADSGTDMIVMDFLSTRLEVAARIVSERREMLKRFSKVFKKFKERNPVDYKESWLQVMSELGIRS